MSNLHATTGRGLRVPLIALALAVVLSLNESDAGQSQGSAQCSPRAPIHVHTAAETNGTLTAAVSAGSGNITSLSFGAAINATFVRGGTLTPAANTTYVTNSPQVNFAFIPTDSKAAVTVKLTATDACGPWPTFVGGGVRAVNSGSTSSVVAAVGDTACDPSDSSFNNGAGTATACRHAATAQLATNMSPDAVLILGDIQYENGSLAKFQASYDPTWGKLRGRTHPVPGNHEYLTPNANGYYSYFGAAAGATDKGYYAWSLPGWRLLALNSNCASVGGCNVGSPQEQWLRAELAAHQNTCLLAYWHHPRFSSGSHGNDATVAPFWQAMYDYRTDIVLNGHDHVYERLGRQTPEGAATVEGIRSFVVGTGGRNLTAFGTPLPNSRVRITQFGVLKLTLRPNGYDWQFVGVDALGVLDSGSGDCHPQVSGPPVQGASSVGLANSAGSVAAGATTATAWEKVTDSKPKKAKTKKKKKRG